MTYEEALAFLEETRGYGSVLGLDNIRGLMEELGNVQEELAVIHIAGTNGKGSVGAMLDAVLRQAGYRVGRYSSPAVFSYEEIWQINGVPITREAYAYHMERVRAACQRCVNQGRPHPTAFEIETALAFLFFQAENCDVVLLETGLGGSMDATDVISHPVCSVITSVSRDHMAFLGDTLSEIAEAKAGIIKEGCPVVSAWQQAEVLTVLQRVSKECHAPLTVASSERLSGISYDVKGLRLAYEGIGEVSVHLTGAYQIPNAACALETLLQLIRLGYKIMPDAIRNGLSQVRWNGRMEHVSDWPDIFLDGAHNEAAARSLAETIENCFTNCRITYIIGVLADKEYGKMLSVLLPYCGRVYTVTPDNPRALPAQELAECARAILREREGEDTVNIPSVIAAPDVAFAVREALRDADPGDVILAWGSLSYLAEAKKCVAEAARDEEVRHDR
ncbi:MAG: bifunctional folylpolyglutamate synthase/dihydrofolate synthase [Lachnospiraceae bacterium]|nr:bifunctional folylpolyglutamate synthase/dihydrofolate synthase [Lachnospiraceae bacterium]